jgi:2-keto-4-pentenoate hydratase/2-oxohepta-3-ene-1,7-dioic acid hydratase in catechol pathway
MRLVTVATDDGNAAGGVLTASGAIAPLARWDCPTVEALVQAGPATWTVVEREAATAAPAWPAGQPLRAPVTRPPRNLLCAGINYVPHFAEGDRGGAQLPPYPVIFTKPWTTITGPADDVVVDPAVTSEADWEAELAVVIGTGGINIEPDQAMDHVFGYCLANDVSARDLQRANGAAAQWHKGKSLDGFCPLGPRLVTPASMPDFADLRLRLTVNGTLKQDFRPADMYWPIPALIAYLSAGMALLPGDVILTGTGSGVGLWRDPPEFLRHGDVMRISCPGLGELRNRVVERREHTQEGST